MKRHNIIQVGADHHTITCGDAKVADVYQDATGKHLTQIEPNLNLEPVTLAYILSQVLQLDAQNRTVQ